MVVAEAVQLAVALRHSWIVAMLVRVATQLISDATVVLQKLNRTLELLNCRAHSGCVCVCVGGGIALQLVNRRVRHNSFMRYELVKFCIIGDKETITRESASAKSVNLGLLSRTYMFH